MTIFFRGTEVPGLNFYGLLHPGDEFRVSFPDLAWPAAEHIQFVLHGADWRVVSWGIPVKMWPPGDDLRQAVRATFKALIEAGSVVVWIGVEGSFCDPPELFEPRYMAGGVLAAATPDGREWLNLDPEEPVDPLTDEVLQELREASRGLSDAGSSK